MGFFSRIIYGVNWWAICTVPMVLAMFVTIFSTVPDVLVLPLGFTAVVCAIFSLESVTTKPLPRATVRRRKQDDSLDE